MSTHFDTNILNPSSKAFIDKLRGGDFSVYEDVPFDKDMMRPEVTVEKIKIPAEKGDGQTVDVEVFRPKNLTDKKPLPALVFFHGGGWRVPGQHGHVYLAEKIATEANCAVLFVRYSLSYEIQYPVALDECYSVALYATTAVNAKKLNIDPTRIAIGGDSAGGNMSASITLLANEKRSFENPLKLQILYYPWLDDDNKTESHCLYGASGGNIVTSEHIDVLGAQFFAESKNSMFAYPMKATVEQLRGIPPALIVTAETDIFREEGVAYGRKLLQAEVPVSSIRVNGVIHGFLSFASLYGEEVENVIDITTGALRRAFRT
ncbi:MAG: Alpha/Beta hydrolase protein [Benjaminiella poitrasii]|nr:MAG: Alpha/Beta hydrolase protein [Benjaminiella poitrasii]